MNKGLPKVLVGAFMLCGCVNAANAETVIIRQAPAVVPEYTTTVTRQTTVVPTVNEVIVPSRVSRTIESSTITAENRLPDYLRRITLMKEQVDLGIAKGWLSAGQADLYKSRLVTLSSMQDDLSAHAFNQVLANELERQLTALNIDITDSMKAYSIGGVQEVFH
ncbi:MAG: hypothetical protein K2W82_05995 [Candidatus Obscuribacterales bacterium]|nr:hypothetical protein [Candidatus Obscuribacterales bacterium]